MHYRPTSHARTGKPYAHSVTKGSHNSVRNSNSVQNSRTRTQRGTCTIGPASQIMRNKNRANCTKMDCFQPCARDHCHGACDFGESQFPLRARARRLEQHLRVIGVELTDRETATARKPAECVREPGGQAGQIIESEQMAIVGRNHQFAFLAR
jgi:hypothetical protein